MIRCNGFCLTHDPNRSIIAFQEAKAIDRRRKGEVRRLKLGSWEVQTIPLDEGECEPPVVHGFTADGENRGEFSILEERSGSFKGKRDPAGTRPLYVAKNGDWMASDHRFFPDEERFLLPPGSTYDLKKGRLEKRRQPERKQFEGTFDEAGSALADLIENAVRSRVAGHAKVAISFSGGIDSAILAHCAMKFSRVVAVSVGTAGSRDEMKAPRAAEELGVEIKQVRLEARDVRAEMDGMDLPFKPEPMDKSLWCIYSIASRTAAELGADVILLGQLADELFGGYLKYQQALVESGEMVAADIMEDDVRQCGIRGFLRDEAACARWTEPRFPFAEGDIMELGLRFPVSFKIRDGVRKAVLRAAARDLGVPERLCLAPKKAAQYSTGVLKLIGQLI